MDPVVPQKRPDEIRATLTPDTAQSVDRFLLGLSQHVPVMLVLMSHISFDALISGSLAFASFVYTCRIQ